MTEKDQLIFLLYFPFIANDKRDSIDCPGARRVSRSSSIRLPNEVKIRSQKVEILLKEENPEKYYNFKNELGRYGSFSKKYKHLLVNNTAQKMKFLRISSVNMTKSTENC